MGRTHALSGAVVWLAAAPALSQERWLGDFAVSLSPAQVAAGAVVCAGAALLPDIDHHNGRIANTIGPVTKSLCKWVGKVSGGHRQATHSILFALAAGLVMDLLATHVEYLWWVALFITVGFGLRGIGLDFEKHEVWSSVADCAVAALAVWWMSTLDMSFAGYAVTLGCLAHIAGDCLTPRGCPIFWPVKWRLDIPLVPRTDGKVERWVVGPVLTLAAAILAVRSVLGDVAVEWLGSG
ncbi:metal-dependent hydrolase [Thermomonospora catenispora]|nr:metal-dependent hydrolase [Thermomonospora catenispora]